MTRFALAGAQQLALSAGTGCSSPVSPGSARVAGFQSASCNGATLAGSLLEEQESGSTTLSLDPRHAIGDLQAGVALFKAVVGPGILFLPSGVKAAGLAPALCVTAGVGFVTGWCMLLLLEIAAQLRNNGSQVRSLGEIGYAAYGHIGRVAVESSVVMTQAGVCTAYCVFIAQNVQSILYEAYNGYPADASEGTPCVLPQFLAGSRLVHFIILLAILPLIPLTWIRQLKYFASTNILATGLVMSTLVYMSLTYGMDLVERGAAEGLNMFDLKGSLVYFGTAVYAFEGVGVLLPIERSMASPEHGRKVVSVTMLVVTLAQLVFASTAYMSYGDKTASIITISLARGSGGKVAALTVQTAWCIIVLLTFPLQLFPAARVLENCVLAERRSGWKWAKNGFRSILVLMIVTTAEWGFYHIDSFVALTGALSCVPLAMVYPAAFHYKVCVCARHGVATGFPSGANGAHSSARWSDLSIIALGSFGVVVAVVLALWKWVTDNAEPKVCILKQV